MRIAIALGIRSHVAFEVNEKNRNKRDVEKARNEIRFEELRRARVDDIRAGLRKRRKS